jgi:cell division septum initiation protein DivIVA
LSFKKRKKVILTATVTEESYHRLKRLIPEGEVSKFIDQIIRESLKKIEEKISAEYEKFNQDKIVAQKLENLNICHYEKNRKQSKRN